MITSINQPWTGARFFAWFDTELKKRNHYYTTRKIIEKRRHLELGDAQNGKIYYVKKGRLKAVYQSHDDRTLIHQIVSEGEFLGLELLSGQYLSNKSIIAMERSEVIAVQAETMKRIIHQNTEMSCVVIQLLGKRLEELEQRVEHLIFDNSRDRVINLLINLIRTKGQRVGYEMMLSWSPTHQDLAALSDTSRQTVTTLLNELRRKGILTFNRRRILVRDMQRLTGERGR